MKKAVVWSLCVIAAGFIGISSVSAQEEARRAQVQQFRAREIRLDRNYDGIVDRIEIYDEKGVIIRIETDTTGNGKMNEWIYFKDGNPTKGERDINEDGKVDTWLRYNKEGIIIKSEADTDGNGKVDTWLKYDKEGILIKSEADTDGDGKVDEWVTYEEGRPVSAERDTNADGKIDTWIIY